MYLMDLFKGDADAPAIAAPNMETMTYGQLNEQVKKVAGILQSLDIKPNSRVATALVDGATATTAFLSIASTATLAPLNPNDVKNGTYASLENLEAEFLIVDENSDTSAIESAKELSIPIITLVPDTDVAGSFSLYQDGDLLDAPAAIDGFSQENDHILFMETSGTTGNPKVAPLTLENVTEQANNIAEALKLTSDDRGMGVVQSFHIHGIMATMMAPLSVGSSVCYTRQFAKIARSITKIMADFKPTWITAVPTTHGAILTQMAAPKNADNVAQFVDGVKIVRSASSALLDTVYDKINELFPEAVVVESLAMTEGGHSIFQISLDDPVKGSVGKAIGNVEVAIMKPGTEEIIETPDTVGELVIRGPSVMKEYYKNPDANKKDFTSKGWFRTGDLIRIRKDGNAFVTGRIKEMIKRGGEQIAPVEVDEAVVTLNSVAEVMTFGIPNEKWEQIVGAAIVLQEGITLDNEAEVADQVKMIQGSARQLLANFKVPEEIVFVDELPKGSKGKLDRLTAAEKFKKQGLIDFPAPQPK